MKPKLLLLTLAAILTLSVAAQSRKKIYFVPKAGTLHELARDSAGRSASYLVLRGKLDATDFRLLRDSFPRLRVLDISHASISRYAGKQGTSPKRFDVYPANSIPAYAFCRQQNDSTWQGKETLTRVILSDKIKKIEESAFKGCNRLRICQIGNRQAPTLEAGALADSVTAIFLPTGSGDAYRNQKEWADFPLIEGNPRSIRLKIVTWSNLANELQKKNVQPQEVNYLYIDGKLDEADFKLIRDNMPNLVTIDLAKCTATVIPDYTFTQKKFLLKVILPDSLRIIGQRAFSGCRRLHGPLMLPATVTAIEYGAFIGCERLKQVIATGHQLTALGDNLFENSNGRLIYQ